MHFRLYSQNIGNTRSILFAYNSYTIEVFLIDNDRRGILYIHYLTLSLYRLTSINTVISAYPACTFAECNTPASIW